MKKIEFNKTYLLTRIYRSEEHEDKVLSAYLEPVFTDFNTWTFIENLNNIIHLTNKNAEDLLKFIENDKEEFFIDGTFVKVVNKKNERIFELDNNSEEAIFLIEAHENLMNEINIQSEL